MQPDPGFTPSGVERSDFMGGKGGGGLNAQPQNCPDAEKRKGVQEMQTQVVRVRTQREAKD